MKQGVQRWSTRDGGKTPKEIEMKKPVGKIEFFRPSNSKLDVMKDLDLNAEGKMFISAQNFKTGPYLIKINYTMENKSYFEQLNYYHN